MTGCFTLCQPVMKTAKPADNISTFSTGRCKGYGAVGGAMCQV